MHEQNYFELAGELPVVTEFIVSEADAERILTLVRKENIDLVYASWPAEYSATSAPSSPACPAAS
jgi:PII-like signaling protein